MASSSGKAEPASRESRTPIQKVLGSGREGCGEISPPDVASIRKRGKGEGRFTRTSETSEAKYTSGTSTNIYISDVEKGLNR